MSVVLLPSPPPSLFPPSPILLRPHPYFQNIQLPGSPNPHAQKRAAAWTTITTYIHDEHTAQQPRARGLDKKSHSTSKHYCVFRRKPRRVDPLSLPAPLSHGLVHRHFPKLAENRAMYLGCQYLRDQTLRPKPPPEPPTPTPHIAASIHLAYIAKRS